MAEVKAGSITEKLAAGMPDRAVTLAYGETRIVDGVELVPVAFVSYGFGGAEGADSFGDGGGGGGVSIPLGAYVGGPDGLRFRPNTIAVLAMAIPIIGTIGYAIKLIVKAAR